MLMLSIDSSGKSAAVGVTNNTNIIASGFENSGFTHSETLLALVDKTLKQANVELEQIEAFAITVGPGSFTGLRIGCALTMGLAGTRMCYPVSTLKALTFNLYTQNCIVVSVFNARCNQVYFASFDMQDGACCQIDSDCAISVEDAVIKVKELLKYNKPVNIIGDGAFLLEQAKHSNVIFHDGNINYVQAYSVALAVNGIKPVRAQDLKLCYLRPSQAERERNKKEGV